MWEKILNNQVDVVIPLGVIGILTIMIIPLPTVLLDLFLTFDVSLGILSLLVAMYIMDPLDFSIFPSYLLIVTLFGLSLNVASTRLILLNGHEGVFAAGHVIKSFGSFVIGDNYVVGMVAFIILVIINFLVITKGAERVAEVSARFTLDAMPGKQMSIDADLNAGLIDEKEAKDRRVRIAQEAEFYGAMDGAIKFVKGDAIAQIIIAFINILGGFVIGMFQQRMNIAEAATTYVILTVGDGLVSQIPALIISTAAGIVTTRAASESNIGQDITKQLLLHPKAIGLTAIVLIGFGLIPGMPTTSFIGLGFMTAIMAVVTYRHQQKILSETQMEKEKLKSSKKPEGQLPEPVGLDPLGLEVGSRLVPLIDPRQGGELLERITAIRKKYAAEMGFVFPSVHIKDNLQLAPNVYSILLKGEVIAQGNLMLGHMLAMNPGEKDIDIEAIPTKDPAFGLPAWWIPQNEAKKIKAKGLTVVDISTIIATHFNEVINQYAHELLTRQEVQKLIDRVVETDPKVVEELLPNLLTLGQLQKVLQNLLHEQISIRDLISIFETCADFAPQTRDPELLTEFVRAKLARSISRKYEDKEGKITALIMDQKLEDVISQSIQNQETGSYLALDPMISQKLIQKIKTLIESKVPHQLYPLLLCSSMIRRHLKQLIQQFIPNLAVLSYNEISPRSKIEAIGMVELNNAN
ncbi:MAG: flagellar biosynthesis protein FlhA [bacterium]